MNFLQKYLQTGEIGTVNTDVTISKETLIRIAAVVIITTVIIVLFVKSVKKL